MIICAILLTGCSTQNQALTVILPSVSSKTANALVWEYIKSIPALKDWGCGLRLIDDKGLTRMSIPFQKVVNFYSPSMRISLARFLRHDGYRQAAGISFAIISQGNSNNDVAGDFGFAIYEFGNREMARAAFSYFSKNQRLPHLRGIKYSNYEPGYIGFQRSRFLIHSALNWNPGYICSHLNNELALAIYRSIQSWIEMPGIF